MSQVLQQHAEIQDGRFFMDTGIDLQDPSHTHTHTHDGEGEGERDYVYEHRCSTPKEKCHSYTTSGRVNNVDVGELVSGSKGDNLTCSG